MSSEIGAPPLLVIGMEGFWGSLVCVLGVYPVMMVAGIEDPYDTYVMMSNSAEIRSMFLAYFLFIFLYNLLAVLVTFMLNSVWHAILDNFRPITVWGTDLFIFYMITDTFGEVRARGPGVGRVKQGVGGFTTREARSIRRRRAFGELRARGPCRGRRIGWLLTTPVASPRGSKCNNGQYGADARVRSAIRRGSCPAAACSSSASSCCSTAPPSTTGASRRRSAARAATRCSPRRPRSPTRSSRRR